MGLSTQNPLEYDDNSMNLVYIPYHAIAEFPWNHSTLWEWLTVCDIENGPVEIVDTPTTDI